MLAGVWARPVLALFGILLALALLAGGRWLLGVFEVATGYSAKQLCSGVFVAGLPESFILENDINLSIGTLGPLLPQLAVTVDEQAKRTAASLLGTRAEAVYSGDAGCVLNPVAETPSPLPDPAGSAVMVVPLAPQPELEPVIALAFEEPSVGQRRTLAVLVLQGGAVLAEQYAHGVGPNTPLQGWSMNKSLMATWVGMQAERGGLDLAVPVRSLVSGADPALAGNIDPALDITHLLHMESGFEFEETYFPGDDATRMLYRSPAMWRVAPGNGHMHAPGEHFSYSSGDTNLASWLWQQSLDRPYTDWLQQEFAGPLGLTQMTSEHDASGVQVGSSYTYMTARDWAAVGQFWLDAWHGRSELLSQAWMRAATVPRAAAVRGNYGRGFWLNAKGMDFPALPRNLFYASGHNGQYTVVFPDQELVVVRLGLSSGGGAAGLTQLLEGVFTTVTDRPVPDRHVAALPASR
jgi:CubicO group peptidase (beta-lactamase class C family)